MEKEVISQYLLPARITKKQLFLLANFTNYVSIHYQSPSILIPYPL